MGGIPMDTLALDQIGRDSKALVDSIKSLLKLGVRTRVTCPRIVVVGDQSSGKSSVLEAISGVRFPITNGVCTRFATEIVFRNRLQEKLFAEIRSDDCSWQSAFNEKQLSKNDLPELIEEAKLLMKVGDDAASVSEDTLYIEIHGPEVNPLRLVDLPGLCRVETSQQPTEEASAVLRLVQKHLKCEDNIILAVVSAQAEIKEQLVLEEVQKYDPMRERTIGIITKPDMLIPGSTKTREYLRLAENLEGPYFLNLGWHVLRSRDCHESSETFSESQGASYESRDQKKIDFGVCATFSPSNNGIESLRRKLSKVVKKHFQSSVPKLIEGAEARLEFQQNRLNSLGMARSTAAEIRQYLVVIAERLRDLTHSAVRGTYDDKFFSSLDASGLNKREGYIDQRKLRAVIRNLNGAFNKTISARGSEMRIVGFEDSYFGDRSNTPGPYHLDGWLDQFQVQEPTPVSWVNLKARLERKVLNDLGSQFPGSSNDSLALELFREQSRPWKGIAKQYLKLAMDSARTFVELAFQHVTGADESTRDAIFTEYVLAYFDRKASQLDDKLDELLVHYQEGEMIYLEYVFRMRLSLRKRPELGNDVPQNIALDSGMLTRTTSSMTRDEYAPIESTSEVSDDVDDSKLKQVLNIMITYYEMSLQTFTNNVTVLAVENCLISKMASLFTPMAVLEMDDDTLLRLGSESEESQHKRLELQNDLAALKSHLAICKKHRPRPSPSESHYVSRPAIKLILNYSIKCSRLPQRAVWVGFL
ncbi:P-loop containing nucleoside triphosphate hydrolase protein [Dactylonectria estremocensis]|uniref:P-loop containing nucleoside triphosphate hydrolase protein n=1 Tax=Dactylonectria estremocensis TaxID=1079267 RepID=A0A9P9EGU6_9HYPO|nr:P-loop containing nucleoside triphosphate hydrolase protein [Dactylonectria estremocensis]